ncbi:hypothetical protein DY000_02040576 [Brassica cretica]|uniref:Nudix hydrolase domain-containing protein n=1 Tax=Brassica cretica TaxID=69181 RepID=A0ABQ7BIF1_BRACR|nr:hypothetical protein DY000_02040576 [Brassica cretica]
MVQTGGNGNIWWRREQSGSAVEDRWKLGKFKSARRVIEFTVDGSYASQREIFGISSRRCGAVGVDAFVVDYTGCDVSKLLKKEEYIEITFEGKKRVRLYIVVGVRDDTAFAPLTKKEISQISWFRLDGLESGFAGLKLFEVAPFLASLKSWISKHLSPLSIDKPLKPPLCVWTAVTKKTTITITTTERRYNVKPWKQSLKVNKSAILPALGICS